MSDLVGLPREPASHTDARQLLQQAGYRALRIIRVDPDAIVFQSVARTIQTAWIYLDQNDRARVFIEPGMPAWPSIDLPPRTPVRVPEDQPESD